MQETTSFLEKMIFGNSMEAYLISLGIFFGAVVSLWLIEKIFIARLKKLAEKSASRADDYIFLTIEKKFLPVFYAGAFYIAAHRLELSDMFSKGVTAIAIIVLMFQGTSLLASILVYLIKKIWVQEDKGGMTTKTVLAIVRVVVWGIAIVMLLDNLGFNVSAIVAGLGIGGVAIALAAQNILGDLFNYFVIFFDRPFEEGDFVIVGDYMGVIEHVGVKTTRIRSLGGEQIIFSNSDLTSSRLRNYKRMQQRRVVFKFGVLYQTTQDQLSKIAGIVKEIVDSIENTRFDRAHFQSFGDSSLDFEVVYYVLSADYNVYMDVQENINLQLKARLEEIGVDFAYPTRTLFIQQETPAGGAV